MLKIKYRYCVAISVRLDTYLNLPFGALIIQRAVEHMMNSIHDKFNYRSTISFFLNSSKILMTYQIPCDVIFLSYNIVIYLYHIKR